MPARPGPVQVLVWPAPALAWLGWHPCRFGQDPCPWPASAQVAMQQGEATAAAIANLRMKKLPQPFQFEDRGEMLSLGVGDATLTGMGLTLAGPLAFQLRRATYLTRLPGLSLSLRSAGAWLLNR